jgi:hypothetical protein
LDTSWPCICVWSLADHSIFDHSHERYAQWVDRHFKNIDFLEHLSTISFL